MAPKTKKDTTDPSKELEKIISKENTALLGEIYQVMGAVVDVKFQSTKALPAILDALKCTNQGKVLVLEVEQHLGENVVRTYYHSLSSGRFRFFTIMVPYSCICGRKDANVCSISLHLTCSLKNPEDRA